jgi:ribose 5-phosphate isomerase A
MGDADLDLEKRAAARAAAMLVDPGMRVGLGTGSTVAHLLPALAERELDITCVATSVHTEKAGRDLGLRIVAFDTWDRLDIAIDGADQVTPDGWLMKGGGGAHTREKIVAAAADRFVVIASSNKAVDALVPPVPVELLPFGIEATLRAIAPTQPRDAPPSPDGGVIADHHGPLDDPERLARRLADTPGVVGHGLFPPYLVADVFIARGAEVEHHRL